MSREGKCVDDSELVRRYLFFHIKNKKPLLTVLAECFLKELYNVILFYVIIKNETFYYFFGTIASQESLIFSSRRKL